nr:hypothetical protein [Tanacetum cinerariifolium]
ERQSDEDQPKLIETTVGRVVPLLPVAPDRSSDELEASVNKLFDEGGSGEQVKQGHSASGGQVVDAGEPSHPVKRLRDDHGTLGGTSMGDKSQSAVQRLLAGAVLNAEVRGGPIPTLHFVTSSVFATPERKDSSHHSGANIAEAEVDSFARPFASVITTAIAVTSTVDPTVVTKEKIVKPSLFSAGSTSGDGTDPSMGGFADLSGSDFLIGGICIVISPDTDLQKVVGAARQMSLSAEVRMRVKYYIRERRRLQSVVKKKDTLLKVKEKEIVDHRAQLLMKEAEVAEAICLRAESSQFKVVEKSLRDEVQTLTDRNAILEKEKGKLDVKAADLAASVKVKEQEVFDLDAVVTSVKLQNDNLADQEKVTAYENCMSQLEEFQDDRIKEMNNKFDKLDTDLVKMALHLEERFYPHLLTTIFAAIGKAVEKGMQDGLYARITHGADGRVLTDVAAYNPFADADSLSALQRLQSVNFSLIVELKSNKDASIDTIMNLLCLEDSLAEKLGLTELQPHVDQLMVPIHHSLDQRVVGASALSVLLDVSSFRVQMIKENIANHRSALYDIFVPLSEPLSVTALTGTKSTLNVIPATVDTTTSWSVISVTASLIPFISTDDYEIAHAEGRESAGANVNPFPNVNHAELNTS